MKVTVVGAGNVGATCADVLAYREVCNEIVLVDIKKVYRRENLWIYFKRLLSNYMIQKQLDLQMIIH